MDIGLWGVPHGPPHSVCAARSITPSLVRSAYSHTHLARAKGACLVNEHHTTDTHTDTHICTVYLSHVLLLWPYVLQRATAACTLNVASRRYHTHIDGGAILPRYCTTTIQPTNEPRLCHPEHNYTNWDAILILARFQYPICCI